MGRGQRSDRAAAHIVADRFGVECAALELANPSFYHLIPRSAHFPRETSSTIPPPSPIQRVMRSRSGVDQTQRITLDDAEAGQFSANAVSFDHCLVLSSCTEMLRRTVEERGFTVLTTPLNAFLRSGGSACCLTLRLDHRSGAA